MYDTHVTHVTSCRVVLIFSYTTSMHCHTSRQMWQSFKTSSEGRTQQFSCTFCKMLDSTCVSLLGYDKCTCWLSRHCLLKTIVLNGPCCFATTTVAPEEEGNDNKLAECFVCCGALWNENSLQPSVEIMRTALLMEYYSKQFFMLGRSSFHQDRKNHPRNNVKTSSNRVPVTLDGQHVSREGP